jgi:hypothetical protein
MFDFGPAIDVAIGLIFVYLLLGLIVSALQEAAASWLKLRGKMLRSALVNLLSGTDGSQDLFSKVYGHSLIMGYGNRLPSYVPSRYFTMALIEVVTKGSRSPSFAGVEKSIEEMPDSIVKQSLRTLVQNVGGDLDRLKSSLAQWYDDVMDRLSGSYKRYSQTIAIIAGFLIAFALNVDTIRIAGALWQSNALRERVVESAQAYAGNAAKADSTSAEDGSAYLQILQNLSLPIGWDTPYLFGKAPPAANANDDGGLFAQIDRGWSAYFRGTGSGHKLLAIIGWLMTGLATSLGAPFWFDTLQRFLQIRGTGAKPQKASQEASKLNPAT